MPDALSELAANLNLASDEQGVVDAALAIVAKLPGVRAAWVLLADEAGGCRLAGSARLPAALADAMLADAMLADAMLADAMLAERMAAPHCQCVRALAAGCVAIADIADCELLARAPEWGGGRHLCVPLRLGARHFGVMNLVGARDRPFATTQMDRFVGVGHQLASALARVRAFAQVDQLVGERTATLTAEIDERKKAEAAQARLIAILDATPDLVATSAFGAEYGVYVNAGGRKMLGIDADLPATAISVAECLPGRQRGLVRDAIAVAHERDHWAGENVLLARDGREIPVSQVIISHRDSEGRLYLSTIARDISESKAQEQRIMRLNRLYAVLSGINTAIVRIRSQPDLFAELCRIAIQEGKFRLAWIGLLDPEGTGMRSVARAGVDPDNYLDRVLALLGSDPPAEWRAAASALRNKNPVFWNDVEGDLQPLAWSRLAVKLGYLGIALLPLVVNDSTVGVLVLHSAEANMFDAEERRVLGEIAGDIGFALEHQEKEARLDYLAYYDSLTGLPNRTLFRDRLTQTLLAAAGGGETKAVAVLDLERFRLVNETLGRAAGDALLKAVAARLSAAVPDHNTLAHIAANRFAMVFSDGVDGERIVHLLDERILSELLKPFAVAGKDLRTAAKVGIALFPDDGEAADTLLDNAEAALERAKAGGDRYLFYSPAFNANVAESLALEHRLRRALEEGQLLLHYQPKIDLRSGRICGLEALLRWQDPEFGLVPPVKFIALLEETGMILDAGRWALTEAVANIRRWRAQGLNVPVSVNVSPIQLRDKGFVGMVEEIVGGAGDIADATELEITESVIMRDIDANIAKLRAVRALGVKIAVDDFGTGYSSLSYIARLPINTLKIDRSFIVNMAAKAEDLNIVSTIITLAKSLHFSVVAEGVETQQQAALLRDLYCDQFQGFLFSPAVSAGEATTMLREGRALVVPG